MTNRRPAVEVEGLRTLRRTLKAAGVSLEDLKEAHAEVAKLVVRAAAPGAPRRTGRLAASTRGAGVAGGAVVRAGKASLPYANAIHWGWRAHHIKAQPWIYDAAENSKDQWTGLYLRALQKIINDVEGEPGP